MLETGRVECSEVESHLVNALVLSILALQLLAGRNNSRQFRLEALILVGERLILFLLVHGCAFGQMIEA